VLSDLLGGVARAHVTLSYLAEPWGMRFATGPALTVHVLVRGVAHCAGVDLAPGDVLLARGPHDLTDGAGTAPGVVVEGPGRSREPGEPAAAAGDRWRLAQARSYGDGLSAGTLVVHALYPAGDVLGNRLLNALPEVVRTPADAVPAPLRDLLAAEAVREGPAQHAVLDRLVDLVVLTVLRTGSGTVLRAGGTVLRAGDGTGWAAALGDPVVGPVLELLHADPARRWTVAELAHRVGVSRALLARRFPALTGSPVVAYLTAYRLDLAAELLRTTDRTLGSIAHEVGYADGFSLSAAYRRSRGRSPSADRGSSTAR
jgi:AraC-like DNA-binding protein